MGLQYKVRSSSTLERWYELRFEEVNGPEQTEIRGTFLPPEGFPKAAYSSHGHMPERIGATCWRK